MHPSGLRLTPDRAEPDLLWLVFVSRASQKPVSPCLPSPSARPLRARLLQPERCLPSIQCYKGEIPRDATHHRYTFCDSMVPPLGCCSWPAAGGVGEGCDSDEFMMLLMMQHPSRAQPGRLLQSGDCRLQEGAVAFLKVHEGGRPGFHPRTLVDGLYLPFSGLSGPECSFGAV